MMTHVLLLQLLILLKGLGEEPTEENVKNLLDFILDNISSSNKLLEKKI